jgi:predicted outer membrane protein
MPSFFCVKLGDSTTTTHGKFQQDFGDHAISRAQAFRWHSMFSEGRTLVEDGQHSRRPSATWTGDNTTRVRELVSSDQRLTVRMIADEVNMNREIIQLILTEELEMRKICPKMVPRNLRQQQQDALLAADFDIQMHYSDATASLLTQSCTCNSFLFQKVKTALKGRHFESTENTQRSVTQVLNDTPQNAFQERYKHRQNLWTGNVQAYGMYFEGEYIVVGE